MGTEKTADFITGLRPNTQYTVRVTALRGSQTGTELGYGEAVGRTRIPFGSITVKSVPKRGDALDVSWTELVGDDIFYSVEYKRSRFNEDWILFNQNPTTASTMRVTGLVHNTDYTVRVRAYQHISQTGQTLMDQSKLIDEAEAEALTNSPFPQPPEPGAAPRPSVFNFGGTGATFDWEALDDVSGRDVTGYTLQWTNPNPISWTNADQSALTEKRCIPNMTVANYGYVPEGTSDQWVGCMYEYGDGTNWNLGDVRYFRLIAHTSGADSLPGPIAKVTAYNQ